MINAYLNITASLAVEKQSQKLFFLLHFTYSLAEETVRSSSYCDSMFRSCHPMFLRVKNWQPSLHVFYYYYLSLPDFLAVISQISVVRVCLQLYNPQTLSRESWI